LIGLDIKPNNAHAFHYSAQGGLADQRQGSVTDCQSFLHWVLSLIAGPSAGS